MNVKIEESWKQHLGAEFDKPYFTALTQQVRQEYQGGPCYPPGNLIFNAFNLCPFDQVKVVIIGQDPYHEPGQAMGLSFSVPEGVAMPPSVLNIFKEIRDDLGPDMPANGDLTRWAKQGVLLLNTVLTVRDGQANSHRNRGWELFTDSIIRHLDAREKPLVFLLWGGNAKQKLPLIRGMQHLVLAAAHPSPLSAYNGFFGCRHFSKCNDFLVKHGQAPINWQL